MHWRPLESFYIRQLHALLVFGGLLAWVHMGLGGGRRTYAQSCLALDLCGAFERLGFFPAHGEKWTMTGD